MFKRIDIYGSKLTFTLNKESELKSVIGGVFTLITFIFYLLLIFLFAKDLYLKNKPKNHF